MKKFILLSALVTLAFANHAHAVARISVSNATLLPSPGAAAPLEVRVVSPTAGETWQIGSRQWLRWKYRATVVPAIPSWPETAVMVAVLEPAAGSGTKEILLNVSPASDTRNTRFTVPSMVRGDDHMLTKLVPGDYKLRIFISDNGHLLARGEAKGLIKIQAAKS